MTEPLFDPAEFRIPAGAAHVCAGGETAFLLRHDAALRQYAIDKSAGAPGRIAQAAQVEHARAGMARLWGVAAEEVGFVSSVAEGVSMIAESVDWEPGDNVVVDAVEYPSVAGPFALQRRPPVALRVAGDGEPGRIAKVVDDRTRVIAVSCVSTGGRHDLHALRILADSVGAMLVVDYTQAAGYLPIRAEIADFAFSACYKWLLGMTGTAVAYWNRARQPGWMPTTGGWHSIELPAVPDWSVPSELRADGLRFTRGNPAHGPLYVLTSALDYLARYEPAAVQRHVQTLTVDLLDRLVATNIPTTTPADPARHGASVCVPSPDAASITDALQDRGIYAWNGHGRVRFSFHGYNGSEDVARIAAALRTEWR